MISFYDFIHEYILKNKSTSIIKIQQTLSTFNLLNIRDANCRRSLHDVRVYLSVGSFIIDGEIVDLHPTKGMHWVAYPYQKNFISNGCSHFQKLSRFIMKLNGDCLYSE